MPDITYNVASFTQAYRQYAVEQGSDVHALDVRNNQLNTDAVDAKVASEAHGVDVLTISPLAARMYAERITRQRRVETRPQVENEASILSSTVTRVEKNGTANSSLADE